MTILESLRDWIDFQKSKQPAIADVPVVVMGETGDLSPPFLGMSEKSDTPVEQNGVVMYGVSAFEVEVNLVTVPADEDNGGTTHADAMAMRQDFYDIIGDRDSIEFVTERNYWRVFDIRASGGMTEAEDGTRVTTWTLTVIACPS